MALRGIKVLEFAGLAPGPFCGMVLADFGASVLRIDRIGANVSQDCTGNGKMSLAINLKKSESVDIVKKLCKQADVLVEPFRAGVMESLGLGPSVLLKENPKLIYARLTGFGDRGFYSQRAGHDINFLGISGLLSLFGRHNENPVAPVNLASDFGGGGLMCTLGIVLALFERHRSNLGQVIDCNMVEGTAYLGSWLYRSQHAFLWGNARGKNVLDGGAHFYETYKTKDGKYMSVGALEPQFYKNLLIGLDLTDKEVPQLGDFEKSKEILAKKFLEKTQEEWCSIFDSKDACVMPILSLEEAPNHPHCRERESYCKSHEGQMVPKPAPKLDRTPAMSQAVNPPAKRGQHTFQVLHELGFTSAEIDNLEQKEVVETYKVKSSKL